MIQKYMIFATMVFWVLTASHPVNAEQANDTLSKIERMVALGENVDPAIGKSVVDGIEKNPTEISKKLRQKIQEKTLTNNQLAVYVCASPWGQALQI